jgi:thioredoxin reductase
MPAETTNPRAPQPKSVAVIGAGAAGIIAGKELMDLGHRVEIFEQTAAMGGVWAYTDDTEEDLLGLDPKRKRVHGSMYANLRTNLPREVMGVSDFPFDTSFEGSSDHRTYPAHTEVLQYLKAYASRFDVLDNVRFSTAVESVAPSFEEGGKVLRHWTVSVARPTPGASSHKPPDSSLERETKTFDAVVVCNGHYSAPRLPTYEGQDSFAGLQLHSHNYRRPDAFVGQNLVVVGAAFSGSDISQELLDHGAGAVYLSGRNWEDLAARSVDSADSEGTRQVIKVADVKRLVPGTKSVEFVDGRVIDDVDVVMYATGYLYHFPFFDESPVECRIEDNRVENLYQHVFLPHMAPSLSFIGIPWKVVPFPLFELQARWIGNLLSGVISLPSEQAMRDDIEKTYKALGDLPKRYTHRFDAESQGEYAKWLGKQCGEEDRAWPAWRRDMYLVSGQNRRTNGIDFREYDLRELGAREAYETFEAETEASRVMC